MHFSPSSVVRSEPFGSLLLLLAAVIAAIVGWNGPLMGDEHVHFAQIQRFIAGDFRLDRDYLTTLPGFHALVTAMMWPVGADSLGAARLCSALFGLGAIIAFHQLRRQSGFANDALATLQFAALPILFPFFFLAYTDVLSLALVLGATVAGMRGRHAIASAVLVLAMLVRQNNVVWVGLLALFAVASLIEYPRPAALRGLARLVAPYCAGAMLFVAYWWVNGSISLSGAQVHAHPDATVHVGNIYYTLFLCGILMPAQVALGLRRFVGRVRARPWLALVPAALFALYLVAFAVDHPYNLINPKWSLRNQLLQASQQLAWLHIVFGVVSVMAACGLASTILRPRAASLLYPVSAIFLASSWLIETRYALIPLALWLAFREPCSRLVEWVTFVVWIVAGLALYVGVMRGLPFL